MTTTHTQGCLAPCWWGGAVSSPTPRPVPVRCTEGFRHTAVEGGESPNQCGVETPGLHTLGLLCPAAPPSPPANDASMPYAHTQGSNAVARQVESEQTYIHYARLCLAWARGPAHVAHARGQYRHLRAVHTASALVSGLLLTWY